MDGKCLRRGYTTGSCAAAAAKAAAIALLSGGFPESVPLATPKGTTLTLEIESAKRADDVASCAVRKDGGDDCDATSGMLIYAQVRLRDGGIVIDGGDGIGRVTRRGLEQPVGAAAINRVPREMIERELRAVFDAHGYNGGAEVILFAPEGVEIARKTHNPRLGIMGGISILGTTGIVEPMSESALIDTIRVELDVLRAAGDGPVLITPGNYGETFSRETLGLDLTRSVLCSNFIGEALDFTAERGFRGVLLVGHVGKLVKLAGGIYQTHSRVADGRMEILAAHAALAGAGRETVASILESVTTDEAIDLLDTAGLLIEAMRTVTLKAEGHLRRRIGEVPAGLVLFSNTRGVLGCSGGARGLIEQLKPTEGNA